MPGRGARPAPMFEPLQMDDLLRVAMSKRATPPWSGKPGPRELRGKPAVGRVARLFIGQGHGFVRLSSKREVFFHRADLLEGTSFNDLQVGDTLSFELLEDAVSGARAVHVTRRRSR
jgi:cold shock CspA family protein